MAPPRLTVLACASLRPELAMLAAEAGTRFTLKCLEMGLHQRPAAVLRQALQDAIDETHEGGAVAIAYGLCNGGIVGLRARTLPLVIPRAHDCIGLLLGSSERYLSELESHPGTYFQSAGWIEGADAALRQPDFTFGPNSNITRERLVERYGEDNAEYLLAELDAFTRHYERLAYIATALPDGARLEQAARAIATRRQWTFERLTGDVGWLRRLVRGDWDERFLIVQPGERVAQTHDGRLIGAEPA